MTKMSEQRPGKLQQLVSQEVASLVERLVARQQDVDNAARNLGQAHRSMAAVAAEAHQFLAELPAGIDASYTVPRLTDSDPNPYTVKLTRGVHAGLACVDVLGLPGRSPLPMFTTPAPRPPDTFRDFAADVQAWQRETFPGGEAIGAAKHLQEEVEELVESLDDVRRGFVANVQEEAADCFLLLLAVAGLAGFDLLTAAQEKMVKNRARTWETEKNARGYRKHVEAAPTDEELANDPGRGKLWWIVLSPDGKCYHVEREGAYHDGFSTVEEARAFAVQRGYRLPAIGAHGNPATLDDVRLGRVTEEERVAWQQTHG